MVFAELFLLYSMMFPLTQRRRREKEGKKVDINFFLDTRSLLIKTDTFVIVNIQTTIVLNISFC